MTFIRNDFNFIKKNSEGVKKRRGFFLVVKPTVWRYEFYHYPKTGLLFKVHIKWTLLCFDIIFFLIHQWYHVKILTESV